MGKKSSIDILERMPGRKFLFDQVEETVANYEFEGERCLIHTTIQTHDFRWADARQYLKQFLPVIDAPAVNQQPNPMANYIPVISTEVMHTVKDTLLENIKQVKNDKGYVAQANSVNNSVRSLIELVKAEVLLARTLKEQ